MDDTQATLVALLGLLVTTVSTLGALVVSLFGMRKAALEYQSAKLKLEAEQLEAEQDDDTDSNG